MNISCLETLAFWKGLLENLWAEQLQVHGVTRIFSWAKYKFLWRRSQTLQCF